MTILGITLLVFLTWTAEVPVACNPKAIPENSKPRYTALAKQLRGSIVSKRSIRGGYELGLDSGRIGFAEAAEWVSLERLCCPFWRFQLATGEAEDRWTLRIVGPRAAKPILEAAIESR